MNNTKEQVFQLFVEKLSGSISLEEEHALEERLSSDPVFRMEWQQLEEKASKLGMGEFLSELDAMAGLMELKGRMGDRGLKAELGVETAQEEAQPETGTVRRIRYRRVLAVAAAVLLAVAGVWMLYPRNEKIADKAKIAELVKEHQQSVRLEFGSGRQVDLGRTSTGKSIAVGNTTLQSGVDALRYTSQDTSMSTLSVPAGSTYKLVLSDGTEVWLNAATRFRFPLKFPSGSRQVEVEGEAYFKVAKNATAPFVVHTALTDVRVLGTSFNVNTYEKGNVRTALVEGKVVTSRPDGQSMPLAPGFVSEYEVSKGFSSTTFDEDDELSWMNGMYYFHDMPVEKLIQVASRCYGIHIVFDKNKLARESLTGVLEKGKLSEFLHDLEATAHIKYYYSNKDLFLE